MCSDVFHSRWELSYKDLINSFSHFDQPSIEMESKVKWISEKILCFNNLLVLGMFCLKFTVWANCFTDPESPDADGDKTLRRHPRKTSEPDPGPGPAPDSSGSGSHAEYIRCLTERLSQSYEFWIHHGLPAIHHVNTSEKLGDLFCGARGQNIWANLHNKDDAKAKRYWLLGEGEAVKWWCWPGAHPGLVIIQET